MRLSATGFVRVRATVSAGLLAAAILGCPGVVGVVSAAYPSAPQITDRYAVGAISVRLTDTFVAPKSATGVGATTGQVARLNFLRSEPVETLASQRCFANDMNGVLSIVDRATGRFSPYLNFDAIFNGVGTGDFDADPGYAAGLVTMQFDPAYGSNGKFYTVHTELGPGSSTDYRQAVLREWRDTNIADAVFSGSHAELLRVQYVSRIHPLGDIGFNPVATDSTHPDWRNMYISSGDGGAGESSGTSRAMPQRLDAMAGKVLRIRTDEQTITGAYVTPADNPFATGPAGANAAVFALGLRNPHRLSWDIDDQGTSRGFLADIGLHSYEEVNLLAAGANYGYSRIEGDQVLGTTNRVTDASLPATLPLLVGSGTLGTGLAVTYPVAMYSHHDGDAISGGFIYRGQAIPSLRGKYVFGDIANGRLFYSDLEQLLAANDGNPSTTAPIHELNVFYDDPATLDGVQSRRVFDLVRDRWDLRNEDAWGSTSFGGVADGDRLPGSASSTSLNDPYGVAYGGGRADIRLGEIDGELYLISKSDGMVRQIQNAIGDADFDGLVGMRDLQILAGRFGAAGGFSDGDFDLSGRIDEQDMRLLASAYVAIGRGDITSTVLGTLPEPVAAAWQAALATAPPPPTITIDVAAGSRTQTQVARPRLLGRGTILKTGTGTLIIDRENTLTGTTVVQAGVLHLAHASGLAASTLVPQPDGEVVMTPGLVASVAGLDMDAGGLVDIGSGSLTVDAGLSVADVVAGIRLGHGHGSRLGTGVVSSVAEVEDAQGVPRTVGYLDHGDGRVTVAYAAPGDSNLDKAVDILDAANFLAAQRFDTGLPASWDQGDFNRDGLADVLDAASFVTTGLFDAGPYGSSSTAVGKTVALPEPDACGLLGVAATIACWVGHQRRRW
jgi:autotransporter-associated beta strand protein